MWTAVVSNEFPHAHILTASITNHRVDLYVPPDVSTDSPVVVMHDGRNVLFPEHSTQGVSWGVLDAIYSGKISSRQLPVVVSVWGSTSEKPGARYFELAPQNVLEQNPAMWGSLLKQADISLSPLAGNNYHAMIVNDVLPEVTHLTGVRLSRHKTAMCGSSMGGLTSLYGSSLFPEIYGTVLSLSTHWAFWSDGFIEEVLKLLPIREKARIWIDRGDQDLDALYEGLHERAEAYLLQHDWQTGSQLQAQVFPGTGHSESAWASRIDDVLDWWLAGIS